jgi:HSP20 family molecular chaperone IbpA
MTPGRSTNCSSNYHIRPRSQKVSFYHGIYNKEKHTMKPEPPLPRLPAISTLIEHDPFIARMREHHQSMVRRAYELFKESGFKYVHDLEVWQRAVFEMLREVPLTVTENDDGISIRAEVPGFTGEDVEVKVDRHRVFIAGRQEKASASEDERNETVCAERNTKEFYREYLLPAEIDPEKVTANLKNGVLEISLSKCVQSTKVKVLSMTA